MRPSSTIPSPPGMSGTAVMRRTKAKTARAWIQLTSSLETPMSRRVTRSTRKSEKWPTSDVTVRRIQAPRTMPMMRLRKRSVATSQPWAGPLWSTRRRGPAIRAARTPARWAKSSLWRM